MPFDLYAQQGRWRQWDKFFDFVFAERKSEDFSSKSALDIGCAVGFSTRALAKRFGRVIGVDADASLIEKANAISSFSDDITVAKRVSYEHSSDLSSWDAYGERFDFIFSGYTLAYLGDVTQTLRHWATLLKPGGTLVVLEIQGLFAIHHPLKEARPWFEKFDKEILKSFGYISNAGALMGDAILSVPELKKLNFLDWQDPELCFDGPLSVDSPVYAGWEERWKRLWPLMSQSGVEDGVHEAFFQCLTSPEHHCEKPIKLLIASKTEEASPKMSVARKDSMEIALREDVPSIEKFFPGSSGGGED